MSVPAGRRSAQVGLLDTSVFIAQESGRGVSGPLPPRSAVSAITVGELRAGVLSAGDTATRALRMNTLTRAEVLDPLPVDHAVSAAWAALRQTLREARRRMPVNDSWIAATAIAHGLAVVTQDDDYDDVPGLDVIKL